MMRRLLKSPVFAGCVAAFIIFLLHPHYLLEVVQLGIFAGADTSGHIAIGKYYADHIFPSTWGWADQWFNGMPFPQFYPPLFYMIMAVLSKSLPFSYEQIYFFLAFLMTLSQPGLLGWIAKKYTGSVVALWVTVMLAVLQVSMFGIKEFGLTLEANFDLGIITQTFGFILLVIWLGFFFSVERSFRSQLLSIIFFTGILLSNVFIIPIALLIFFLTFYYRVRSIAALKLYSFLGLIPLAIASVWYIPLFLYSHYTTTAAPQFSFSAESIIILLPTAIFTFCAVWMAKHQKNFPLFIVSLATLFLLIPAIFQFEAIFWHLPFQTYRYFGPFLFLGTIAAGYVSMVATHQVRHFIMRLVPGFIIIFIFFTIWLSFPQFSLKKYFYADYQEHNLVTIRQALVAERGTLAIESTPRARSLYNVLTTQDSGALLRNGYIVFNESSPTALFMLPVKDLFSHEYESTTMSSPLFFDRAFMNRTNVEVFASRLRQVGLSHVLTSTQPILDLLRSSQQFSTTDFGFWKLLTLKNPTPAVEVLQFKPTLLFSPQTFKRSFDSSYDYIHIQDEILYRADEELIIAQARSPFLDEVSDLDQFSSLIVTEYRYQNQDVAFEKLKDFSRTRPLILISDSDPLFARLEKITEEGNISIFERLPYILGSGTAFRHQMAEIFTILENTKIKTNAHNVSVADVHLNQNSISFSLQNNPQGIVPVRILMSHFPTWQRADGKPVYIASPTYMVTFADTADVRMEFITPLSVYVGRIISGLGILGAIIYFAFHVYPRKM